VSWFRATLVLPGPSLALQPLSLNAHIPDESCKSCHHQPIGPSLNLTACNSSVTKIRRTPCHWARQINIYSEQHKPSCQTCKYSQRKENILYPIVYTLFWRTNRNKNCLSIWVSIVITIKMASQRPMQHIDRKDLYTNLEIRIAYLHSFLDFSSRMYPNNFYHCTDTHPICRRYRSIIIRCQVHQSTDPSSGKHCLSEIIAIRYHSKGF
jgi:hypothetical protein